MEWAIREWFEKLYDVEVEVVMTDALNATEDFVRIFREAGALIISHGCQSAGMIWSPVFSYLDEL